LASPGSEIVLKNSPEPSNSSDLRPRSDPYRSAMHPLACRLVATMYLFNRFQF